MSRFRDRRRLTDAGPRFDSFLEGLFSGIACLFILGLLWAHLQCEQPSGIIDWVFFGVTLGVVIVATTLKAYHLHKQDRQEQDVSVDGQ